jgi:hypothetical protein
MTICCLLSAVQLSFLLRRPFVRLRIELRFQELLRRCSFFSPILFCSPLLQMSSLWSGAAPAVPGRPAIVARTWVKFQNCCSFEGFRGADRIRNPRRWRFSRVLPEVLPSVVRRHSLSKCSPCQGDGNGGLEALRLSMRPEVVLDVQANFQNCCRSEEFLGQRDQGGQDGRR